MSRDLPVRAGNQSSPTLLVDAEGAVLHASSSARTVLGARETDLLGQSIVHLTVWSDRARVIAWLAGGGSSSSEIVFNVQRRPGMLGIVAGIASRVQARAGSGVLVRLVEVDDPDVGEDEGLALQQLRSEVAGLAQRNDELSDFAMILAHDLRAPLMSMMAATQGLVRIAGNDLTETALSLLGVLQKGIHQTSEAIDASLRCSRAGTDLRFGLVDCDELVGSVLERLRPSLERAGATVDTEHLAGGAVIADREQLALVFSNLVENAILHGFTDRPLHLSITSEDGPVMRSFAVADNGRGIQPGDRERVFRMFERLDHSRPGSGIGLAVCQRIVEAHGGGIGISDNDSGGVTVRFTVPGQALTT